MHKNPWTILSSKEIYENKWIKLTEYEVVNPGGGNGIYGKVHFKNRAIGVVVLDDELNTYLVGQYRFTLSAYSWEIPEGGGSIDETPLAAAQRELLEETGIIADRWEKILDLHLSNSVSDELGQVFLAMGLHYQKSEPEETEELEVRKIPFEEAYHMVIRGEITDSLAVAGILRTKLLLQERSLI
jgi:8-oxo-dGTP pyrophosphatase MutT (NUDIX family)